MGEEIELCAMILPDDKTKELAIDLSRKVSENFKSEFVLDGKNKFPHVTVYQTVFPKKNTDSVVAYLKIVAGRTAPFEISLAKFARWRSFIFWNAEDSNEFTHLHKSVLYQLNPLREGLVPKRFQSGNWGWDMSETYQIQNYGSILFSDSVKPHITITKLSVEQDTQKVLQELKPRIAKFVAQKMHLGVLGEHGTVTEILEEFPFGGQSPYMLKPQNYF